VLKLDAKKSIIKYRALKYVHIKKLGNNKVEIKKIPSLNNP
jgi:hypothetical protein